MNIDSYKPHKQRLCRVKNFEECNGISRLKCSRTTDLKCPLTSFKNLPKTRCCRHKNKQKNLPMAPHLPQGKSHIVTLAS